MIICHQYQFIFIKTRKTAGSSVEIALSRLCSEGDVVTPLSAERGEERLRQAEGGYGPTGHRKAWFEHRGFKEWRRLVTRGQRASYAEHMTAPQVRSLVGPTRWQHYRKISIERNPWDRAVSRYWWQKHRWEERGRSHFPTLSEYIAWLEVNKPHWLSNWSHYTIADVVAVDRMLFYEELQNGLWQLGRDLGVDPDALTLPKKRAKGGMRKDSQSYPDLLMDDDRNRIASLCWREIREFGYEFDDHGKTAG